MLRIVTYNVHKCRGMDARTRPGRIATILHHLDADVIALQEVLRGGDDKDQLAFIQAELKGYEACFGETRKIRDVPYGNAVLSRLPLLSFQHYDITATWRGDRGCLRADLALPNRRKLFLFNAHLGTGYIERRKQAQILVNRKLLSNPEFAGFRIVLGDFNEWTRGLTTKLLAAHLQTADLRPILRRQRSYPGMMPFMHLDHVYFDPVFKLVNFKVYRTKLSLIASDHLPLVAEFEY